MAKIGYTISTEQLGPTEAIDVAKWADQMDFEFLFVSDHFHPWVEAQGQSPFVWNILGAISQVTDRIQVGTAVTCPIMRYHPVIVAQAAATSAAMMEDRFILGIGTGENLNEHVIGQGWPRYEERKNMMIEAVEIIRLLWTGDMQSYEGNYYKVDNAKIYTLPKTLPPIIVGAAGPEAAAVAAAIGDGLISTAPDEQIIKSYQEHSVSPDAPKYGQMQVCYSTNLEEANGLAMKYWPTTALHGQMSTELKTPKLFEDAVKNVRVEDLRSQIVMGDNVEEYIEKIQKYIDAGFDHIYLNQIGPNQQPFMEFCNNQILPRFS